MATIKEIKIPEMNKDLAYLCGVLVGDGSIAIREFKNEYLVNCGGNPKDEVEYYDEVIVPLFKTLFDLNIRAKIMGKTYGINIYSKNLVLFLLKEMSLPRSPKNEINIPTLFLNNREWVLSFIEGVADTDFSFKLRKHKYPIISGCSKSKNLMTEISNVLQEEGFHVVKQFDYKIIDPRFKRGYNIINRVDINGHKAFTKWIDIIGTRHPKNLRRINLWKENNKK